jgi:hypothetical protein
MLTDLYLLPLLSGQKVNMRPLSTGLSASTSVDDAIPVQAIVTLDPLARFSPPFVLPVLLPGLEATISGESVSGSSDSKIKYTFMVAFGSLKLAAGGLVVSGSPYTSAVDLEEGGLVSWMA